MSARTASSLNPGADARPRLQVDAPTLADLQRFGGDDAAALFEFLDRCRSEGGQKALRRRLAAPWCRAQDIEATQQAVRFIMAEREHFNGLPSGYVCINTQRYLNTPMPMVRQQGRIEFGLAAFAFWFNDEQFYSKIILGLEVARRLVIAMQRWLAAMGDEALPGELQPMVEEARELLARPELAALPEQGRWFWQKLRMDQAFRMHERSSMQRLLALAYELDALVSLADATEQAGLVLPHLTDGSPSVVAEGLYHPGLPDAVGNPLTLDDSGRVLFLTGPNMAGKTTYLRALATAIYMAHLGMGVAAQRFRFTPFEYLFSAIAIADDLQQGVSYFRAEALRARAVAKAVGAGKATLAIFDEPFKGTNIKDAYDAVAVIMERLAEKPHARVLVSSHLIELAERLQATSRICFGYFEANEHGETLSFDYRLGRGVSQQRLGMRVLEEEGVFRLLDGAGEADASPRSTS